MRIVRRRLVVPSELSGIWIDGDDGGRVKVGAFAALAGEDGIWISGTPINEIEIGVVGAGHPGHAAAVFHGIGVGPGFRTGLTLAGRGVPMPLDIARFRVAGFEETGNVHGVATDSDKDVAFDDEGRHGAEILHLFIRHVFAEAFFAVLCVQRNEPAIGRHEVEPVAVHAESAIADEVAALVLPAVVPDLFTAAGVDGEDVIGDGEVENSVDFEGRRFDGGRAYAALLTDAGDAVKPLEGELIEVARVDLSERAEAAARVVAIVGRPSVGGRFEQGLGVEPLG